MLFFNDTTLLGYPFQAHLWIKKYFVSLFLFLRNF